MTDKQKVIVTLTSASETCTSALSALASDKTEHQISDLPMILKDLDSLLALIFNSSTKLSLVLKPASPTYSASLPLISDLMKYTSGVIHCTHLLNPDLHGATLIKQVKFDVKVIVEALRALLQTFLNLAVRGPSTASSGSAGEEYLVRTGALHHIITQARGPNGIQKDNLAAICRKWKQDRGALEDGLREVHEMIQDAEKSDQSDYVDADDGWNELGLGHEGARMDKDELARAKNVHSILRLTTLLHKRILLDLLSSTSIPPPSNVLLDGLLLQSHALLAASDELVSSLYVPQNHSSIRKELLALLGVINALQLQLRMFFPDTSSIEQRLSGLSIEGDKSESTPGKPKADKRWFDICFDQVIKTSASLAASAYQSPPGMARKDAPLMYR